jgi:hypothetical protein
MKRRLLLVILIITLVSCEGGALSDNNQCMPGNLHHQIRV